MMYFSIKLLREKLKNTQKSKWLVFKTDGKHLSFFSYREREWKKPLSVATALEMVKNVGSQILKFSSGPCEYKLTPDASIETVDQLINFLKKSESESESESDSDFRGNDEALYTIPENA